VTLHFVQAAATLGIQAQGSTEFGPLRAKTGPFRMTQWQAQRVLVLRLANLMTPVVHYIGRHWVFWPMHQPYTVTRYKRAVKSLKISLFIQSVCLCVCTYCDPLLCFHGYSSQEIKVDFSEPCLTLRDLLCRRYGVRNPSLCGLRYEGIAVVIVALNWLIN